jgi:hypothetical protein
MLDGAALSEVITETMGVLRSLAANAAPVVTNGWTAAREDGGNTVHPDGGPAARPPRDRNRRHRCSVLQDREGQYARYGRPAIRKHDGGRR